MERRDYSGAGPDATLRRTLWWATFTVINGAALGISARSSQCDNHSLSEIALTLSLLLCVLKFFQWTHGDEDFGFVKFLGGRPEGPYGPVPPSRLSRLFSFLAVIFFLVGYGLLWFRM